MNSVIYIITTLIAVKADLPVVIWGEACPKVEGMPNFDATRYTGQWFQLSSLPFVFASSDSTCVWANYTLLSNGNVGVNNSGIDPSTGNRFEALGEAALTSDTAGELDVEFYKKPSATANPNYFVLETDYNEFSYVWSCQSFFFAHVPMLWILNRGYDHTVEYIHQQEQNAVKILEGFGYGSKSIDLVVGSLDITDQSNCDYNVEMVGKTFALN